MARQEEQQQNDPVVAAIERVLKAEHDGVEQLRRSRDEARQLLSGARARAVEIARRTDACITKLHTAYLQKVQRDIQAFADIDSTTESPDHAYDRGNLVAAARRAAAKLSGAA